MRLIIFFVAIALAAGAFVLTSQFTAKPKESGLPVAVPQVVVKDVPTVDIYVAKQDISIGTSIKPEMLDIQPYPKNLLLEGMVQADPHSPNTDMIKMVARTPFQKGEPLFMNKLGNERDPSFLAAALPKGMRMVTIAVDTVSGVGNFVYPGDRVDIIITHDVVLDKYKTNSDAPPPNKAETETVKKDPITEILLSNVKVLAVNQKPIIHDKDPVTPLTNVSIEVSAVDAQKLRLSESGNGRLSLALRSLKDRDETELARPTGLSDLSRLTPPAYFPVLYDNGAQTPPVAPETAKPADTKQLPVKNYVNVVRGIKEESVEVSQP